MNHDLVGYSAAEERRLAYLYRATLLDNVIPFWLRHGIDREYGGILTALDRDGTVIDTDKSIWFQGRGAWMLATLYNTVEPRPEWLEAAAGAIAFLRRHGCAPDGKMYFTVTREGRPLRMRRYVYSESFAVIAHAAYAKASGDARAADDARRTWETFLRYTFVPGMIPPKTDAHTRPLRGLSPLMMTVAAAQEIRANLGEIETLGRTCSEWIDRAIGDIERYFVKPDLRAVMESVLADGSVSDHFDGRLLNPGHAIEAAWFILEEARHRGNDPRLARLGLDMLDWMWGRGWDTTHGGILYYRDLHDRPIQEYWHDMKFWWPHNEAVIATLLAWKMTGEVRYAAMHRLVHDWAFARFPDPEFGEWYGYLHRDGSVSVPLKGNMWKGPFHLPRMLWFCARLLGR